MVVIKLKVWNSWQAKHTVQQKLSNQLLLHRRDVFEVKDFPEIPVLLNQNNGFRQDYKVSNRTEKKGHALKLIFSPELAKCLNNCLGCFR